MIKKTGNVSIAELFTYDVVSQPGFVVSSIGTYIKKETREEKRKKKIRKILKNPLK